MGNISAPKYWVTDKRTKVWKEMLSENHVRYHFQDISGSGVRNVFSVFPGIELIYNDFNMMVNDCGLYAEGNLIEFNYCSEGREEGPWDGNEYLYLGERDICISSIKRNHPALYFPTGHYKGITVLLDFDYLYQSPPEILQDAHIDWSGFPGKFCPEGRVFVIRDRSQIEQIFTVLYDIPEKVKTAYLKVKVVELLLYFSLLDAEKENKAEHFVSGQVETVKAVHQRLCANLCENTTIERLAREFCISPTALKTTFKEVYGVSIMDSLKIERMKSAARLLRQNEMPVFEVAAQMGYQNASKFSAAFKKVIGLPPMEYRRKCKDTPGDPES